MLALTATAAAPAQGATLQAGVGRADITPPTGYFMMGWVRSDARITGQNTRLFARVIVLKRGSRKVALVSEDVNAIAGGMLVDAANMVRDRGFSERNVLDSASHTHAAPTGFYNFGTYNTVFPTTGTPTSFNTSADPQLYTFMVKRLALAIRRADDDLAPAAVGWGKTNLLGLTRNRSIEAHLADHGILEDPGQGSAAQDPLGYPDTIDPEVNVLRVDKLGPAGCRVPVGVWSTFANHGTVNKFTFHYYNEDHHGSATRVVEDALRRSAACRTGPGSGGGSPSFTGRVLASARHQDFVNVYGNTDEGDQSAGLDRSGPAASDYVGRVEASHMLSAWRAAGRHMTRSPRIDLRWTRICFCGQDTDAGPVDDRAVVGFPLLTGSEEGRGPLFDLTHVSHEGDRLPVGVGPQGVKIPVVPDASGSTPTAVPLLALRIADRMIVSIPGEMTAGMGRRVRAAVLAASRSGGIVRTVISGLANEYVSYFTTPEEYDRQHYEGGSTMYGRTSSELLKLTLVDLAKALVQGKPAPQPYAFDPRHGLHPTSGPFGRGPSSATIVAQPGNIARLARASFSWRGGKLGVDRPLDGAFVTVRRRDGGRWRSVDTDLGLRILWTVDSNGVYRAQWEAPLNAPVGTYSFLVTANGYRIASRSFKVVPSHRLVVASSPAGPGRLAVGVFYPAAVAEKDLTYRPAHVNGGSVAFRVGSKTVTVRQAKGIVFSVAEPGSTRVTVPAGAAHDRFGNSNANALVLRP